MKKSVTNGRDSFDSILPDYGRKYGGQGGRPYQRRVFGAERLH